ncbi:MAG: hypothetical protein ACRDMX_05510 [Solirubrobacteraceae bacterium]
MCGRGVRNARLAVSLLAASALLALAPAAGADTSCAAPAITPASTAVDVPIGGGSASPPDLTVSCDGSPAPGANVDISVSGSAGFNGQYFFPGDAGPITADANGVVVLPDVTSLTTVGPFTITASWQSATTTIAGDVTGSLGGNPAPPNNPALNETVGSDVQNCPTQSASCQELATYNGFRQDESLGPLVLPDNWTALTIPQQLFVLTQLERTARGLPPESGLADDWDQIAQQGADAGTDPDGSSTITPYRQASPWLGNNDDPGEAYPSDGIASIWAGATDPLQAFVLWMYQDGLGANGASSNLSCSPSDQSGCWGHRDNILNSDPDLACQLVCAMGAATGAQGDTEVFPDGGNNADPLVFTWSAQLAQLPACERNEDSCSWSGQPIVTSGGGGSGGGGPPPQGARARAVRIAISRIHQSGGRIAFTVRFTAGRGRIRVIARAAHHRTRRPRVRRRSATRFVVTARLPAGRWRLTISILPARGYRAHRSITRRVTVPAARRRATARR